VNSFDVPCPLVGFRITTSVFRQLAKDVGMRGNAPAATPRALVSCGGPAVDRFIALCSAGLQLVKTTAAARPRASQLCSPSGRENHCADRLMEMSHR